MRLSTSKSHAGFKGLGSNKHSSGRQPVNDGWRRNIAKDSRGLKPTNLCVFVCATVKVSVFLCFDYILNQIEVTIEALSRWGVNLGGLSPPLTSREFGYLFHYKRKSCLQEIA